MIYIILFLLPLAIGASILRQKWNNIKCIQNEHKEESRKASILFYQALKLKYLKIPIVVTTDKEEKYQNKLLRHYGNRSRKVVLLPKHLGESNYAFQERKKLYIKKYCDDHKELIEYGYDNFYKEVDRIKKADLLAFLESPFDTEESKQFIYEFIDFLLKHPKAVYHPAVQNPSTVTQLTHQIN